MTRGNPSPFRLTRSTHLPEEVDFDPFGGDLDAQRAWKNFGGTSLREAYELFLTNPIYFTDDFAHMGGVGFAYYFPVLDRFVREVVGVEGEDDEVMSLGFSIEGRFDGEEPRFSASLVSEVEQLSEFVLLYYRRYLPPSKHHRGILRAWEAVEHEVAHHTA